MNLVRHVDKQGHGAQETVNIIPSYYMGCRQESQIVHNNEVSRKSHQTIMAVGLHKIMSCYGGGINMVLTKWSDKSLLRNEDNF